MTRADSPVPLMHHDPERSWITDLDPDHPRGTQPYTKLIQNKRTKFQRGFHEVQGFDLYMLSLALRTLSRLDLPPFSLIGDFGKQNTAETFPNFPRSILRVIDRSARNPP